MIPLIITVICFVGVISFGGLVIKSHYARYIRHKNTEFEKICKEILIVDCTFFGLLSVSTLTPLIVMIMGKLG